MESKHGYTVYIRVFPSTGILCHWICHKSHMQDIWQEISEQESLYKRLWSFGVCSLWSRECGLYEAADILLGDLLSEKSVTVQ